MVICNETLIKRSRRLSGRRKHVCMAGIKAVRLFKAAYMADVKKTSRGFLSNNAEYVKGFLMEVF